MPRISDAEEDSFRYQAKLLRLGLHSKRLDRRAVGYSQQQTNDFAALMLHQCFFENWPPPAQLVLLITELLQEGKNVRASAARISAPRGHDSCGCAECNLADTQSKSERRQNRAADLDELHLVHTALASRVGDHAVRVNVVGRKGFVKSAKVEASYPPDPSLERPSTAPLLVIAEKAKVSRSSIRRWRLRDSYRALVDRIRSGGSDQS